MPRKKPDVIPRSDTEQQARVAMHSALVQEIAEIPEEPLVTLRYSADDMQKLDQFAIGLLRDGSGSYDATDVAFVNRVRAAYLRAEVMLTIRKEIAALEA